jgi:outer membrane lipoprotein-sorting protein
MKKPIVLLIQGVIFVSLLGSCAKRQVVVAPPVPEEYRGPVNVEVLKESAAFQGISSVRSTVQVRAHSFGEKMGTFKGVFLFQSPDNVRLKLLSPMGLTAMDVVMSAGGMELFLANKKTVYTGDSFSFGIKDKAFYGLEESRDSYVLYAFTPREGVMEIAGKYSYDKFTLRNTGITAYRKGMETLGILLADYRGRLPFFMRFAFFNGLVLEMTLEDPELGIEVPQKFFEPLEKDGKKVLPLEALFRQGSG